MQERGRHVNPNADKHECATYSYSNTDKHECATYSYSNTDKHECIAYFHAYGYDHFTNQHADIYADKNAYMDTHSDTHTFPSNIF